MDSRDPEGRADCYTDDAVYEYEGGEKTVGRDAFIEKLRGAADPHDSLHWTTNHIIEGTGTEAKGTHVLRRLLPGSDRGHGHL